MEFDPAMIDWTAAAGFAIALALVLVAFELGGPLSKIAKGTANAHRVQEIKGVLNAIFAAIEDYSANGPREKPQHLPEALKRHFTIFKGGHKEDALREARSPARVSATLAAIALLNEKELLEAYSKAEASLDALYDAMAANNSAQMAASAEGEFKGDSKPKKDGGFDPECDEVERQFARAYRLIVKEVQA